MRLAVARRNEALNAILDNLNTGKLRFYSGTRPTDADTALSGNTLLAELTFGATAFAAASGGVANANAISDDTAADATGTASFARLFESDGTTVVCDLSVGTSGTEIVVATTSFVQFARIQVTALAITFPVGA
jgi:hypothetical protein